MKINGTLIWYYFICKREVWLMSHQINAYQDNDLLEIGRVIHSESYKRDKKEIQIGNMKFDIMRKENGELLIGEIKKSSRYVSSSKMQLAFYLRELRDKYQIHAKGRLLFPKEKKQIEVELNSQMEYELDMAEREIFEIMQAELPPPLEKNKFCSKCAYKEFCWS
ncbi:CRISPR-associated protein Cas4 [bacterium]|nr:CRISPR-associated protein Cas4 [bacterium]